MYWIIQDVLTNPHVVGKYFVAGTIGVVGNIFSFYVFTHFLQYWYIFAAMLSAGIGFVIAFLLHKYWTFADYNHDKFTRQALAYFMVSCFNMLGALVILTILVEFSLLGHVLSQTVAVCVMATIGFFINRHVTFNHKII